MTTYNEYICKFEVYDNPPKKKGFERHHITPASEQIEPDNRQIYVSFAQHMWLHILYDREHNTHTAQRFLSICGKPAEYFDCFEKCLAYQYTLRKKREEGFKKSAEVCRTDEYRQKQSNIHKAMMTSEYKQKLSDSTRIAMNTTEVKQKHIESCRTSEFRQKQSDIHKGNTIAKGRHHFNNGVNSIMAYECPDGYVPGRLKPANRRSTSLNVFTGFEQ